MSIDFEGDDWAAHRQEHWKDFAGNPNFPDYLRLVFVAYLKHAANGHAVMERGELAHFLVRKDGTLPERRVLWRALQASIQLGFLEPGSQMLCLMVPKHAAQKAKGDPDAPCRRSHKNVGSGSRRSSANVGNGARRSSVNVRNDGGRFAPNVGSDDRRSTLSPSLSSPLRLVSGAAAPEPPGSGEEAS